MGTQSALEEEQRNRDDLREQYGISERRANALQGELEESRTLLEQADRARRQAETELAEAHEQLHDLAAQAASSSAAKRKLESELQTLHADLDEMLNEAKNSEEKAKKAMVDAARLADELRAEQEHAQSQERMQDLVDKLQQKIKTYKRQIEEAEEIAALNLAKFRKAQQELEEADERADLADQAVAKLRA